MASEVLVRAMCDYSEEDGFVDVVFVQCRGRTGIVLVVSWKNVPLLNGTVCDNIDDITDPRKVSSLPFPFLFLSIAAYLYWRR